MLINTGAMPLEVASAKQDAGFILWLRSHPSAIAIAGLLSFAGPIAFVTGALSVMRGPAATDLVRLGLWWILYGVSLWAMMLIAGYGCERLARGTGRTVRGAIWLVAACVPATVANILTAGRTAILIEQGVVHSAGTAHLYAFIFTLIITLLYFAHLRRSREHERAAGRLAAAQMAQRDARRRIVQARLQELQARIDPQLLFEMLDAARRLYERDAELGERFLDELIAFLRAALPRLRSASSSLLREIELARAYVRLKALAGAPDLAMTIDVASDVMHARFPPGVLLPLLDSAVVGSACPCALSAMRAGRDCKLVLNLGAAPSEGAVARVQPLLSELYGTSAALEIARMNGAVGVIVKVPYEHA